MLRNLDDLLGVVARLDSVNPPPPFPLLDGVRRVQAGEDANQVRLAVGSTRKRLESLAAAADRLPDVFVIGGVPGLTGAGVGAAIPDDLAHLVSLVHAASGIPGKRALEERVVVAHLVDDEQAEPFRTDLSRFRDAIQAAGWFILSARRAAQLLKEKLFDRVYAVRVPRFTRNYRNAELDMHFSLSQDLTPLKAFLASAKERGLHGFAVDLERGVV